jgi:hypothetical protein
VTFPTLVDALLPNREDRPFDEISNATFIDDGHEVGVSPVDQLLLAVARRVLSDPTLGGSTIVQLPRFRHRAALLLAISGHLLCRQPPAHFHGPVVLIGFDIDIAGQLRQLGVQNHRRMGLARGNPLSAHRLTRTGDLQPVIGSDLKSANSSLVYFNTRVGRPELACDPPLVILDATSVAHPAARTRALEWALDHRAAAIVAVGDIGDDGLVETMSAAGVVPTVLFIDAHVVEELTATLGRPTLPASQLSSVAAQWYPRTSVTIHLVPGDDANGAVTRAFQCIAAKPDGPMLADLDIPMNMLRNGTRLAARLSDYRTACTYNPRPGEAPNLRYLERMNVHLPPNWHSWQTTRWGAFKVAVGALWRAIEEDNPKLRELWRVLDRLARDGKGPILIRCHSRAAADATQASLSTGERTPEQVELWDRIESWVTIATCKERYPAGRFDAQLLSGAPAPWQFSILLGIEAPETYVLAFDAEAAMLRRQGERWTQETNGWQTAGCRTLSVSRPPSATSPVPERVEPTQSAVVAALRVPGLSLTGVLDLAAGLLDPVETGPTAPSGSAAGPASRACIPVRLDDGRTWWCVDEEGGGPPVLVLTAAGHEHRPVDELVAGDRIVVPAGEGTESIHARLVAASRGNDDVRSLDVILSQFRSAAKSLIGRSTTQREAIDRLRDSGAHHPDQLPHWARGTTIAPREPDDVAAVFSAAGKACPDLNLIYAVAETLRSLSRTLGRFVAAIATGRGDRAVDQLRELVGPVADELLDEFVVVRVGQVGAAQSVSSSVAGRIR